MTSTQDILGAIFPRGQAAQGGGCLNGKTVSWKQEHPRSVETDSRVVKRISKSLVLYLEQECGQPLPDRAGLREMLMAKSKAAGVVKVGLPAINRRQHPEFTHYSIQLLKLTLIAAINSPRAKVYIGRMQTFSTSTQAHLKNLIEESLAQDTAPRHTRSDKENQNSDSESDVEGTHYDGGSLPSNAVDVDLLFEERFGKLMAEKDVLVTEKKELQEDLRSLHNRLTRLQENNVSSNHSFQD